MMRQVKALPGPMVVVVAALMVLSSAACTSSTSSVKTDSKAPTAAKRPKAETPQAVAPTTSVEVGSINVQGALDKAAVDKALEGHHPRLNTCFTKRGAAGVNVSGSMALSVQIAGDGRVLNAQIVDDGIGDFALAKCVAGVGKTMAFGVPTDGAAAYVSIPITHP